MARGKQDWRREWMLPLVFPGTLPLPSWVSSSPAASPALGTRPCAGMAFRGLQGAGGLCKTQNPPGGHPNPRSQPLSPPSPSHLHPNPLNAEAEALRGSPCPGQGGSLLGGPPRARGGPRELSRPWLGERSCRRSRDRLQGSRRNKPCPEGGSAAPGMSPGWFSRQEIPGKAPVVLGWSVPVSPRSWDVSPTRVSWGGGERSSSWDLSLIREWEGHWINEVSPKLGMGPLESSLKFGWQPQRPPKFSTRTGVGNHRNLLKISPEPGMGHPEIPVKIGMGS